MITKQDSEKDNVCCPELAVVECGDTKEHCHLVCMFSNAILQNNTIKELCIGENFKKCVNLQKE
jgi:hypothetical protein